MDPSGEATVCLYYLAIFVQHVACPTNTSHRHTTLRYIHLSESTSNFPAMMETPFEVPWPRDVSSVILPWFPDPQKSGKKSAYITCSVVDWLLFMLIRISV